MNGLGKDHTTHRGTGHKRRQPTGQTACIDWMKPVHILRGINCGNDFLRVDLFGERQLDQNTADVLISIELGDEIQRVDTASLQSKARMPDSATALDLLRT